MSADLARSLTDLGEHLRTEAPEPEVARISVRIDEDEATAPSDRRRRSRTRRTVAAIAAAVTIGVVTIPPLRSAVAELFGIDGVEIRPEQPDQPALPAGAGFRLGERFELADAQEQLDFTIVLPHVEGYADPTEIYVRDVGGGIISFVYPPPGDAPDPMILTQFEADPTEAFEKILRSGTIVERLTVNGAEALWLTGREHLLFFVDPTDGFVEVPGHIAGNTLLWTRGDVTLRLEGDLTREQAVALAESVHP